MRPGSMGVDRTDAGTPTAFQRLLQRSRHSSNPSGLLCQELCVNPDRNTSADGIYEVGDGCEWTISGEAQWSRKCLDSLDLTRKLLFI